MFGEKSCHHPTKHAKNGKSFQNQPSFFGGHQQIFRSHVCSLFLSHGCLSFSKSKSTEKFHLGGCRQGIQLRMNLALTKKKKHDSNNWGCMRGDVPGDSIRDLFIPDRWRSLNHFKGSLNHRKKGTLNHQVYAWKTVVAVDFHQMYS